MKFEPVPYYPKHAVLAKHISYYYFLNTDDDFETRYYAFPHTHTVLNLHEKANTLFESDYVTYVYADDTQQYTLSAQGIRDVPLLAHLKGRLNKVTILFKPLGFNHFIRRPLYKVLTRPSQYFTDWDKQISYNIFLSEFYANSSYDIKADLLETFLMGMYYPLPEYVQLQQAIELLSDVENSLSVEGISEQLNLNERTFNRLFNKHVGVSPIVFRKVARFRHSLQNKVFAQKLSRLTDLAYQSNYYDQAYFNKIYRQLTGLNPQKFFNDVEQLADNRLIFQFVNQQIV